MCSLHSTFSRPLLTAAWWPRCPREEWIQLITWLTRMGSLVVWPRVEKPGKGVGCRESSVMKKRRNGFPLSLSFSLPIPLPCFCCSTLCERSSSCTPSLLLFFSLSVPLFLCFVPALSLSLSPSSFPFHAVVCRHAGISGPQNDRPNLSALAPVTKDGRLGSVWACDWCTSELLPMWLFVTCLSTAHERHSVLALLFCV